jgi:prepilin-type processing-associated H-X9-DG protein/prepilin-type N-terminal cleavage/methylation domain-containing protein
MQTSPDRSRTAFTLIELLVVVAIIGILAALLFAGVSSSKGKAQRIQCVSNVRQLGQAMHIFISQYNAYPLRINSGYWKGTGSEHFASWDAALESQMSAHFPRKGWSEPKGVWHCPTAKRPADFPTNRGFQEYGYNGSGVNSIYATDALGLGGHKPNASYPPPVVESEIAAPSEMMAIADGFHGSKGVVQDGAGLWRGDLWPDFDAQANLDSTKRSVSRHQGKANVVFCDGHVESLTLKFLYEDTSDAALSRWNRDNSPHRDRLSP